MGSWILITGSAAALFLSLGILRALATLRLLKKAVRSEGKIAGFETDAEGFHFAKINFTTADGRRRMTVVDRIGTRKPPVDDTLVQVLYYPDKPEDAKVHAPVQLWLVPGALTAAGLIALFYCLNILGNL